MRSSEQNILKLALLISLLVVGTFSDDTPVSLNADGTCPSGRTVAKVGSTFALSTNMCVVNSKLVYDCLFYSNDASSTCTCDSSLSATQLTIYMNSRPGCVPVAKQVVNCPYYNRVGANNYYCTKCPSQAPYLVTISTLVADSNLIPKACSKDYFPNCDTYKVYARTFTIASIPAGGYVIGCKVCKSGYTAFATANPTGFTYLTNTDNGVACPMDGSYGCAAMVFTTDKKYACDCGSDTLVQYVVTQAQLIEQGCLASTAALYDANCQKYTYNANPDLSACDTCKTNYYLLSGVVGPASGDSFDFCFKYEIEGCSTYATTGADGPTAAGLTDVWCTNCATGYTLIQTTTNTINAVADTSMGYCGVTGRWIIQTSVCLNYAKPKFNYDLSLTCADCQSGVGSAPPCYADGSAQAGGCTGSGMLSALKYGDLDTKICLASGIIDNCKSYTSFDSATNTATGCSACKANYLLVNTTSTTLTQMCIPSASAIVNCSVYNNKDFTCAFCDSGLPYDTANSRCKLASDIGTPCSRAVQVGTLSICIACPYGYTIVNNFCTVGVSQCSNFDVNGACTSCIDGFKLINKNCVMIPENCINVDSNGGCTSCKPGFEINSNNTCSISTKNTCASGYVPSNGQCVPVQKPIQGCVNYTIDSKCSQCIDGYFLSSDSLSCILLTSLNNPNLKPCPPNTNKLNYRRNPSNPTGDCVAVDINCVNSRDDGYCIECLPGNFAYTDGLCYKIIYGN